MAQIHRGHEQARADQGTPGNLGYFSAGALRAVWAASAVGSRLKILPHYFTLFVAVLVHFLCLSLLPLLPSSSVLRLPNQSALRAQLYCCSGVRWCIHPLVSSVDDISVPEG